MELREDVYDIKKELQEVKKESFAFSILSDYKRQNKRLFIALVIVLVMWFTTIGAFLYYIINVDYEEVTEISGVETEEGDANACVGDSCNNGVINGESNSN